MNNESIDFLELQNRYPNLKDFNYVENTLVFPDGKEIFNFNLDSIDHELFQMSVDNLYIYLVNGFNKNIKEVYEAETNKIFELITQFIITDDEVITLKNFANDFWLRISLFYNEPSLANNELFMQELNARRKVITECYRSTSAAATIVIEQYNDNLALSQKETGPVEEKGYALTRKKNGETGIVPIEDNSSLGVAGFASLMLVIASAVATGIMIALNFIK